MLLKILALVVYDKKINSNDSPFITEFWYSSSPLAFFREANYCKNTKKSSFCKNENPFSILFSLFGEKL